MWTRFWFVVLVFMVVGGCVCFTCMEWNECCVGALFGVCVYVDLP